MHGFPSETSDYWSLPNSRRVAGVGITFEYLASSSPKASNSVCGIASLTWGVPVLLLILTGHSGSEI